VIGNPVNTIYDAVARFALRETVTPGVEQNTPKLALEIKKDNQPHEVLRWNLHDKIIIVFIYPGVENFEFSDARAMSHAATS